MTQAATHADSAAGTFFADLENRNGDALLGTARGTARFDVRDGRRRLHWLVTIGDGRIDVSRRKGAADAVLELDGDVLEEILSGRMNAMAAVLRGDVKISGDPRLLVLLQRIFPRPVAS